MDGHGLHFDTHCPHCGNPLEYVDGWQPSKVTSVALLDCRRCKDRWVVEIRMALAARLPRRLPARQA